MHVRLPRNWPTLPAALLLALIAGALAAIAAPDQAEQGVETPAPEADLLQSLQMPVTTFTAADRMRRLGEKGMTAGSPIMLRIFKVESELELWLWKDKRFELFAIYPICFWSGGLGPKLREGDRQAPEGLYSVGVEQLHRKGRHPRSLDLGFPNALDRAHARTGSNILVHGGCRSIGCYAVTNPVMEEVYTLSERAMSQGQERIEVHIFPFRMTEANLAAQAESVWHGFWLNLKEAYDAFERTRLSPRVGVCAKTYFVSEGAPPGETSTPASGRAWEALGTCERDEAEAALWQLPDAKSVGQQIATAGSRVTPRSRVRRFAGRNARKAYAAARRARVIAHVPPVHATSVPEPHHAY
jgi:murein L,D-transpeptidase YafK